MESVNSDYLINLRDEVLLKAPTEFVPVEDLVVGYTPRVEGEDTEYARMLADSEADLPPILVHRPSMTVVDGLHRLRAARLRGQGHIAVRFFDGAADDAALLAIATNVAQGRPLSLRDRTAAAERVVVSRPYWSDRAVAAVAGLSPQKVAQVRRLMITDTAQPSSRVGRDGRARPVSSAHGRELAGRIIQQDPTASLRQVARQAGISPATVADVRNRLARGEHPVPPRQLPTPARVPEARPAGRRKGSADLLTLHDSLRRDPTLRLSEAGRNVLRMLDVCAAVVKDRHRIVASVPAHCKEPISQLADGYAETWQLFADDLRQVAVREPVTGEGEIRGAQPR